MIYLIKSIILFFFKCFGSGWKIKKKEKRTKSLYSMVRMWAAELKRGSEGLEDDPRPRRPVTVTIHDSWYHHGRQMSIILPLSWIPFRTAFMQSSKMNFICLRCRSFASQTSFDLIWNGLDSTCEGKTRFLQIFRWDLGPPLPIQPGMNQQSK